MITCYGLTKASILFFYRRIFVVHRKTFFDIFTIALLGITVLWTLGFVLAFAFNCGTHFSASWGSAEDIGRYCKGGVQEEKGMAVSDLILDVIIISIPIPLVSWPRFRDTRSLLIPSGHRFGG